MSKLHEDNMSDIDDPERSYRRGYTHGARDMNEVVRGQISAKAQARLEDWLNKSVRNWRLAAMTGRSKREADGKVTADLVPPRHLLRRRAVEKTGSSPIPTNRPHVSPAIHPEWD